MRLAVAGVGDDALADGVSEPGLHRCPLVCDGEVGQHRVARPDVVEVALDDLRFVSLRVAAEVAAERIDRYPTSLT